MRLSWNKTLVWTDSGQFVHLYQLHSLEWFIDVPADTHVAFEEPLPDEDQLEQEGDQPPNEEEGEGAESGEEKMDEMKVGIKMDCFTFIPNIGWEILHIHLNVKRKGHIVISNKFLENTAQ